MKEIHLIQLILSCLLSFNFLLADEFPIGKYEGLKGNRLPVHVEPQFYNFKIKTYVPGHGAVFPKDKEFTFEATVKIMMAVKEETDVIVLNSVNLTFTKDDCFIKSHNSTIMATDVAFDKATEKVAIILNSPLSIGKAMLTIKYTGEIRDDKHGLYRHSFGSGAVTQFEPMEARLMVPCFDEPAMKAVWSVSIIHPNGTTALSNQIEIGEPEEDGDFLITRFKPTVPMSSYLLAICVSDFAFVEGTTSSGVRMRIWARPHLIQNASYALKAGIKCVDGMEKLYGKPYPMEKLDMVGVDQFAAGAMENWGLIVYKEYILLLDESTYLPKFKRQTVKTIAHELAHQWFGNLVTMEWWDDLWLNEGFAAYAEVAGQKFITDGVWDSENDFVHDTQNWAFATSIFPIVQKAEKRQDIGRLIRVVYKTGASVISMLSHLLQGNFDEAIRAYLHKFSYKNANRFDFLRVLEDFVPKQLQGPGGLPFNITEFALPWLYQESYPLLNVDISPTNSTFHVIQKSYDGNNASWLIPIWYHSGKTNETSFLWQNGAESSYDLNEEEGPLVLNADSRSFVRVNYSREGWERIFKQLNTDHTIYSVKTRYQLIRDAINLSNISVWRILADLTAYVAKEKDFLPLLVLATAKFPKPSPEEADRFLKTFVPLPTDIPQVVYQNDADYVAMRADEMKQKINSQMETWKRNMLGKMEN